MRSAEEATQWCALSKGSRGLRTRGWGQGWERKEVKVRLQDVRIVKGTCDSEGEGVTLLWTVLDGVLQQGLMG